MQRESFQNYKKQPVIISPNLGKPTFIDHTYRVEGEKTYKLFLNIIARESETAESIKEILEDKISLEPLYDHDPRTGKLIRGDPIALENLHVRSDDLCSLKDEILLENFLRDGNLETGRECDLKYDSFDGRRIFYEVKGYFTPDSEILEYLETHNSVMFDLIQSLSINGTTVKKTNYHAVVLTKQTWESFSFVQITDLHVTKRNDEVLGMIRHLINAHVLLKFGEKIKELDPFRLHEKPLEARFQNPNNALRLFNRWANIRARSGNLDFILATGDLIDYCVCSHIKRQDDKFEFENTNWNVLYNLILNNPIETRPDYPTANILSNEELALPIFMTPGNHDSRGYKYNFKIGKIYKKFGLTGVEANLYRDVVKMSPYKALIVNKKCLKGYHQYFNAYNNYFIPLGKHTLVFLHSGPDKFLAFKSLLMASPACTGYSDNQFAFLQNVIKHRIEPNSEGLGFLISHAPLLNPIKRKNFRKQVLALLRLRKKLPSESFKESTLLNQGITDPRADLRVSFLHGGISGNWDSTLRAVNENKMLVINGHTHKLREFRTETTTTPTYVHNDIGKRVLSPCKIYWDDYSKIKPPKYFMNHLPLHLQTPSLGIGSSKDHSDKGALRIIQIQNNQVRRINVHYLHDFIPDVMY